MANPPFECNDACSIIFSQVFPFLGGITSILLCLSPWKAVTLVIEAKSLNKINTFPLVMMIVNSFIWMLYSYLIRDYYVFIPNAIGWGLGVFFTFATFPYESINNQYRNIFIIIGFGSVAHIGGAAAFITANDPIQSRNILGTLCVAILMVFYSSPLSSMYDIIKTKNAASINPGLALTTLANTTLWTLYGIILNDFFVIVPNGIGVLFAVMQLALMKVYPSVPEVLPILEVVTAEDPFADTAAFVH